jgi:hypothetical protein
MGWSSVEEPRLRDRWGTGIAGSHPAHIHVGLSLCSSVSCMFGISRASVVPRASTVNRVCNCMNKRKVLHQQMATALPVTFPVPRSLMLRQFLSLLWLVLLWKELSHVIWKHTKLRNLWFHGAEPDWKKNICFPSKYVSLSPWKIFGTGRCTSWNKWIQS